MVKVKVMLMAMIMDGDSGADGSRDGDDEKDGVMQFLAHRKGENKQRERRYETGADQ